MSQFWENKTERVVWVIVKTSFFFVFLFETSPTWNLNWFRSKRNTNESDVVYLFIYLHRFIVAGGEIKVGRSGVLYVKQCCQQSTVNSRSLGDFSTLIISKWFTYDTKFRQVYWLVRFLDNYSKGEKKQRPSSFPSHRRYGLRLRNFDAISTVTNILRFALFGTI